MGRVPGITAQRDVALVWMEAGLRAGVATNVWFGRRDGCFAHRLSAGGVSPAGSPLESAGPSQPPAMSGLVFRLPTEAEAGAQAGEVATAGFPGGRLAEPEEGVALHRTLPQVFARFGAVQLEHEGVLLLPALIVILHHHQSESTLFKVQAGNLWPKEQANLAGALKHQNSGRSET